jgi:hypothetical protein
MAVHPLVRARQFAAAARCKRAVEYARDDSFARYSAPVCAGLFARLRASVAELERSHAPEHLLLVKRCVPVLQALAAASQPPRSVAQPTLT